MTVTPAATRAHGWVSGPSPMAYQGVMLSMPVCHLGGFFGGFGRLARAAACLATWVAIGTSRLLPSQWPDGLRALSTLRRWETGGPPGCRDRRRAVPRQAGQA